MLMPGHPRWLSGMFVKTPVRPRESMSAWGHVAGMMSARASTRPIRNVFTTLFLIGQVWETCQLVVFCTFIWSPISSTRLAYRLS